MDGNRVSRVRLKHYRSIRACDVPLGSLTFLVGPNGSGKSNFLDALRLVADGLTSSLDQALRERGGVKEVRRRSQGYPNNIGIRLDLNSASFAAAYAFEIGSRTGGGFELVHEKCRVERFDFGAQVSQFEVRGGTVTSTEPVLPVVRDRLYLVTAASLPEFRVVFDVISRMGFYNLNPEAIRDLQTPDAGDLLTRDGGNLASVLHRLAERSPEIMRFVQEQLSAVVPGVVGVERVGLGPRETLEFRQEIAGSTSPWRFPAQSMSDGTLRALGVITAVFQSPAPGSEPTLIGIEEPEVAVHPAAAAVLGEALLQASRTRQIVVTSHSPELLDDSQVSAESIVAMDAEGGVTRLARPEPAAAEALRRRLYTPGELLRVNQLIPDPAADRTPEQLDLFDGVSE